MALEKPLIVALILAAAITVAAQYAVQGPGWDLIAHYMSGRSLANPNFYQCLLNVPCGLLNQDTAFYFEAYRAPLSVFALAGTDMLFGSSAIIAYIALVFLAYLFAIHLLAKKIGVNDLLLYAVLLSPLVLYVAIIPGSEEIMSLIFLLISIGYLADRSPMFGLFLGLATLGKFPVLAFIPMLLLLVKPRKIFYAVILFAAAVLPWLLFSQVFFGNALFSYGLSFSITLAGAQNTGIDLQAYSAIFEYALVFLALVLVAAFGKRALIIRNIRKSLPKRDIIQSVYNDDGLYLYAILIVFLLISLAETLYVAPHYDTFTQTRYGYLLAVSSVLLVAVLLDDLKGYVRVNLPIITAVVSIAIITVALSGYLSGTAPVHAANINNPAFTQAKATLVALGYSDCRIVSNDWVYMLYENVSAFSEFDPNTTVASQYPMLVFHNQTSATNEDLITNIAAANIVYSSYNYSVLLPQGYECYSSAG